MNDVKHPAFLESRPKILMGLGRDDLMIVGCLYIFISFLKIGGLSGPIIIIFVLGSYKIISPFIPRNFYKLIFKNHSSLSWQGQMKKLNTINETENA